jgi:hypothetical protein
MANIVKRFFDPTTLICLIPALSGCAMLGLAVPAAVGSGAAGVNYSFTNVAYKTISYLWQMSRPHSNEALQKMDIKEMERTEEDGKVSFMVVTGKLNIYIDLEKVTRTVTSIKVNAKKGSF